MEVLRMKHNSFMCFLLGYFAHDIHVVSEKYFFKIRANKLNTQTLIFILSPLT
jgi:hypothetical protein